MLANQQNPVFVQTKAEFIENLKLVAFVSVIMLSMLHFFGGSISDAYRDTICQLQPDNVNCAIAIADAHVEAELLILNK